MSRECGRFTETRLMIEGTQRQILLPLIIKKVGVGSSTTFLVTSNTNFEEPFVFLSQVGTLYVNKSFCGTI